MSRINEPATRGGATKDQLKEKVADVTQDIREMGGQVRDAAQEKYEHLRDQAAEYYEHGRETAREWQGSLETYVRDQPLKAVLIAAGVGVLLGVIWKRS